MTVIECQATTMQLTEMKERWGVRFRYDPCHDLPFKMEVEDSAYRAVIGYLNGNVVAWAASYSVRKVEEGTVTYKGEGTEELGNPDFQPLGPGEGDAY